MSTPSSTRSPVTVVRADCRGIPAARSVLPIFSTSCWRKNRPELLRRILELPPSRDWSAPCASTASTCGSSPVHTVPRGGLPSRFRASGGPAEPELSSTIFLVSSPRPRCSCLAPPPDGLRQITLVRIAAAVRPIRVVGRPHSRPVPCSNCECSRASVTPCGFAVECKAGGAYGDQAPGRLPFGRLAGGDLHLSVRVEAPLVRVELRAGPLEKVERGPVLVEHSQFHPLEHDKANRLWLCASGPDIRRGVPRRRRFRNTPNRWAVERRSSGSAFGRAGALAAQGGLDVRTSTPRRQECANGQQDEPPGTSHVYLYYNNHRPSRRAASPRRASTRQKP